jgi:hypothetical protein
MTKRFWVIGGEYEGPDFRALIPGTETMAGPYDDERRAKTEWTRLSGCPEKSGCATVRYAIAAETLH